MASPYLFRTLDYSHPPAWSLADRGDLLMIAPVKRLGRGYAIFMALVLLTAAVLIIITSESWALGFGVTALAALCGMMAFGGYIAIDKYSLSHGNFLEYRRENHTIALPREQINLSVEDIHAIEIVTGRTHGMDISELHLLHGYPEVRTLVVGARGPGVLGHDVLDSTALTLTEAFQVPAFKVRENNPRRSVL